MKSLRLPSLILCGILSSCYVLAQAQDRVVLLRDTTRLGISLAELERQYAPALDEVTVRDGVSATYQGVFRQQPAVFFDSLNAHNQRFLHFANRNKKRLPGFGMVLQITEFIRPDGTYERVFCRFDDMGLTDEQQEQVMQFVAEWYGQHPFPLKTRAGFRMMNMLWLGVPQEARKERRGPGIIATLLEAERTTRPDTVKVLAFNQLELRSVPDIVYRFPKLEELDLSKNSLNELPARLTADIPTLKKLSVLYNAIPNDSVFVTRNRHLESLNLQGNKLSRIPRSVRKNRRLTSLWMGNNNLTGVDWRTLRRLRRLNDLNLYNAGLTILPRQMSRLKRLTVLDLYYNKLTTLPPQLGRMKRLEQLAVSHNDLSELPASLARLPHLRVLFAHHNRISQLPDTYRQLTQLRVLDLSYNWITVAPPVLAQLPALEELALNNNNLQEFPMVIQQIPNLKKVYLSSNPMFGKEAKKSSYARQIEQLEAKKTEVFY